MDARDFLPNEQSLAAIDEDYEPEPETQALIAQLRRRHAIAS